MASTAVSTSQAVFASTLTLPPGPSASRTAATRSRSADSGVPGSATFTFAVEHPEAATIPCARSGSTTGTVQLTGIEVRSGAGHDRPADSSAHSSHGTHSASE